jgi:hypothetical protein
MMKNKLYIGLAFMLAVLVSCEDEPGDFFEYGKAFTELTFENYEGFSAEFTDVDNVQITVNSSNEAINQVQVFRNLQFIGEDGSQVSDRDLLGTVSLSGGQGTLDVSLDEVFATTGATADNLNELTLDFVAEQNGQTTYRRFDVDVVDPLTIEGPAAGYNDSVATFSYNFLTQNEIVENIEFFTRLRADEEFVSADVIGVNDLTGQGDFLFNLPAERDLPVGSTLTVRSRITTEQGRTFTIDRKVTIEGVPLGEVQSFTLNAADTSGFSLINQTETATVADADIRLMIQEEILGDEELVLTVGESSNSTLVQAPDSLAFEGATFQEIRDVFETAADDNNTMEEIDLGTSPSDAVYIVRLGNVPAGAENDSRRYAIFRVADLLIDDPLEASTATIEYRVKAEEEGEE